MRGPKNERKMYGIQSIYTMFGVWRHRMGGRWPSDFLHSAFCIIFIFIFYAVCVEWIHARYRLLVGGEKDNGRTSILPSFQISCCLHRNFQLLLSCVYWNEYRPFVHATVSPARQCIHFVCSRGHVHGWIKIQMVWTKKKLQPTYYNEIFNLHFISTFFV